MAEISLKRLHLALIRPDLARSSSMPLSWLVAASSRPSRLSAPATQSRTRRLSCSLCIAAALAQRGQIEVTGAHKVSISLFPILLAAVLCGPIGAMAVSVASMLGEETRPFTRWVLYASSRSLTGAVAGVVAAAFGLETFPSILAATAAAAVCTQILDLAFAALVFRLRGHGSPVAALRETGPLSLSGLPLYVPAVSLLAWGYLRPNGVVGAPTLSGPSAGGSDDPSSCIRESANSPAIWLRRTSTLSAPTCSLPRHWSGPSTPRDEVYGWPLRRGRDLRDATLQRDWVCRMNRFSLPICAGLVHDIGKIGLPPGLLEKPGALTLEERRQMEEHPAIGERILAKVDDYAEIAKIVRHHHERVDGQGYPDGLAGEDIPLLSRIIAVADAYNAMTSDRPYRDAMPSQVARMRLAQAVESQFDTRWRPRSRRYSRLRTRSIESATRFDFGLEAQKFESDERSFEPHCARRTSPSPCLSHW